MRKDPDCGRQPPRLLSAPSEVRLSCAAARARQPICYTAPAGDSLLLTREARAHMTKHVAAYREERAGELQARDGIEAYHLMDEDRLVGELIERAVYTEDERRRIADLARGFVH